MILCISHYHKILRKIKVRIGRKLIFLMLICFVFGIPCSPSGFGFKETDYELPELEESYASLLKKRITDIQYNKAEDKFGWRYKL